MINSLKLPQKLMFLRSGELGKEFLIAAKRLDNYVIAVDFQCLGPMIWKLSFKRITIIYCTLN